MVFAYLYGIFSSVIYSYFLRFALRYSTIHFNKLNIERKLKNRTLRNLSFFNLNLSKFNSIFNFIIVHTILKLVHSFSFSVLQYFSFTPDYLYLYRHS